MGIEQPSLALKPEFILSQAKEEVNITINPPKPSSVIKPGSRGLSVTQLQKTLKALGYFQEKITGIYGSKTQASVKQFQTDQGLKSDGIAGVKTLMALEREFNQKIQKPSPTPPKPGDTRHSLDPAVQPSKTLLQTQILRAIAFLQNPQFSESPRVQPEKIRPSNSKMVLIKTLYGGISPKSIVHSGSGLFFAQNMMYRHTVTIYDRQFNLVKTLPDRIELSKFGYPKFSGIHQGSPVEASFSPDGKYGYVSNYKMYGKGFNRPGTDQCSPAGKHDPSFLYKINTENLTLEAAIQVGSVPKYTAVTPDNRFVLVSNWCSWDLSIVDTQTQKEIKRISIGRYPRGIAVDSQSEFAYIAVMGSSKIAKINLNNFSIQWLNNIGRSPRHLNIDPEGKYLYTTLNSEGKVAKIDLSTGKVLKKISTGNMPRSMVLSEDGEWMYVVNYRSNTVSKVRTQDMRVLQTVKVNHHPIGITYDSQTRQVWVACYSGSIMVFQD